MIGRRRVRRPIDPMARPPELETRLRAVVALLQRNDLEAAGRAVAALKAAHADVGDVWALDGEVAVRQGRIQDALTAVDRAAALEPELAERHVQRARCQIIAGRTAGAAASAATALRLGVSRLDHLLVLGGVLVRCGDQQQALEVYLKAQALAPDNADVQRGLASVHRYLGDLSRAEAACDAAIRLDPEDLETIGLRSSLRTVTPQDNHIDALRALEARGVKSWRGAVHLAYALAKEYEDLGRHSESFECLRRGAALKRRHTRYDLDDDLAIFPAIREAFSAARLAAPAEGHATDAPIFVVGMPRTGSTLIERIISAHGQVQGLGELNTLSLEMMRLVEEGQGGARLDRSRLPELAAALPMRTLAERYLRDVAPLRDTRPRFVDKLPLNCLNIGLIHLAMPSAAIVHVVRDPLDACYAMFKYLFRNGYPFSYDLKELGAYYAEYYRLMDHWRSVLPPGRMYDVRYEDVVADLAGEARRLIAHLGLPWDPRCEEFHANRSPSMTGSAAQVRRRVYATSVGRWKNLAQELAPLRGALAAGGVPLG
jgi:tetratricopeptide (TPR) repeat protein